MPLSAISCLVLRKTILKSEVSSLLSAGVTRSAVACMQCKVSWHTEEPSSSGAWHGIPSSTVLFCRSVFAHWILLATATVRVGRVWEGEMEEEMGYLSAFPSAICLFCKVFVAVCLQRCAWYGGSCLQVALYCYNMSPNNASI